ncbi:hypothetical protein CEXT_20861 [Caerostris extrusa]|uniref:Uncharacterized protein n=1 Tax=Caerostris extrusa TaxID=172846 RepID=A0AAV4NA99_CAEEX|nr:hypothetical protein CEXT_20861 [Caerostris extrusa]
MMANLLLSSELFTLFQKIFTQEKQNLNNYLPSFGFRPEEFPAAMRSGASDTPEAARAERRNILLRHSFKVAARVKEGGPKRYEEEIGKKKAKLGNGL